MNRVKLEILTMSLKRIHFKRNKNKKVVRNKKIIKLIYE